MTNPTPHRQVPEALIDLIDAYAETRHRCGGIYNAKTEAARKAVIEALSGVQALSAAPAGWKLVPVEPTNEMQKAADEWAAKGFDWPKAVYRAMLAASPTPPAEQPHPDDTAVDRFAEALKAKLAAARAKGRGGWDTPECTQQRLSDMLREHVDKGDPRDVANFCLFLWARGEAIAPPAEQQATNAAPAWADQAVIEYRYTGGTYWCPLGPAERMKPDFDGVYRLQAGVYPVEQAAPKAAPGAPSYSEKWDAELGRTAMRFVDRAGDVHPGIDDAETICAEFYKAMSEVIERMPHVQRMTPRKAAPVCSKNRYCGCGMCLDTVPAEWLEQAYREGWAACRDAETIGEEAEYWAFGNSTANSRMIDAQQAAPRQEA